MTNRKPAVSIFFAISLTAVLSMHVLAHNNGTFDHRASFAAPGAYLPDTSIRIQAPKTGVKAIDGFAALMLAIFSVDLDPRNVVAHIQGTHFLGTLSAVWMVMLVEAHRIDTSSSFLVSTYILETVAELFGVGFITPLWCALHLSTTQPRKPRRMDYKDSIALPAAFILGHFVPTAMMVACDAAAHGFLSQQAWVLARLFHPLFSYVIWRVIRVAAPSSTGDLPPRVWYVSAMLVSTLFHVLALAPVLMPYLCKGWLDPAVISQLDLWAIFIPAPFWSLQPQKVTSFAHGVSMFLQWDEFLAGVSIVTWAWSQRVTSGYGLTTYAYIALLLVFGGPGAAAAYMMLDTNEAEESAIRHAKQE